MDDGTRHISQAFLEDFEMTYLIDVPVEFFNKVRIEIEGKFSFDIIPIDEVEDGIGKLIPQS